MPKSGTIFSGKLQLYHIFQIECKFLLEIVNKKDLFKTNLSEQKWRKGQNKGISLNEFLIWKFCGAIQPRRAVGGIINSPIHARDTFVRLSFSGACFARGGHLFRHQSQSHYLRHIYIRASLRWNRQTHPAQKLASTWQTSEDSSVIELTLYVAMK